MIAGDRATLSGLSASVQCISIALLVLAFLGGAVQSASAQSAATRRLIQAAEAGDVDAAKRALETGAEINDANLRRGGLSPLTLAIQGDHVEVAEMLLERGADAAFVGSGGATPLHAAADRGHVNLCRALLGRGADVNATAGSRRSPLHLAARHGRDEVIGALFEGGARINEKDATGRTALHLAMMRPRTETARLLVKLGSNVGISEPGGIVPLERAASRGATQLFDMILERLQSSNPNLVQEQLNLALGMAVVSGRVATSDAALVAGADANWRGESGLTVLHVASDRGDLASAKLLLSYGAKAQAIEARTRWTSLHFSVLAGRSELVVRLLVEKGGANANATDAMGRTALHVAAMESAASVLDMLLEQGARTDVQDVDGNTPLHLAAARGARQAVSTLLKGGADATIHNEVGRDAWEVAMISHHPGIARAIEERARVARIAPKTAGLASEMLDKISAPKAVRIRFQKALDMGSTVLSIAIAEDSVSGVRFLLAKGVDVNERDRYGYQPLHKAAERGNVDIVELLIESGAPIADTGNPARWSPLHFAAARGHADVVRELAHADGDLNLVDGFGRTPLDISLLKDAGLIQAALVNQGARRGAELMP